MIPLLLQAREQAAAAAVIITMRLMMAGPALGWGLQEGAELEAAQALLPTRLRGLRSCPHV